MAIILDADVIIRGEEGSFDLHGWVAARPDEEFEVAAITIAELWHGVERAKGAQRTKRERYLQSMVASLPIITYTEQTAYHHARIWAELEAKGKMIGYYDIVVAATAPDYAGSKYHPLMTGPRCPLRAQPLTSVDAAFLLARIELAQLRVGGYHEL